MNQPALSLSAINNLSSAAKPSELIDVALAMPPRSSCFSHEDSLLLAQKERAGQVQ